MDKECTASASEAVVHWKIRRSPSGTDSTKTLRAPTDTNKQIQMMAPEIYRWWWADRSRGGGDKLFWKTGMYGVAMRGGL